MTLPDFLVVGSQRSGSTWLDRQLRSHPGLWLPQRRKEVHFFDSFFHRGLGWYEAFFPDAPHDYDAVGEVCPDYLRSTVAPARIHSVIPDCRIVAILRDPVARLYSAYGLSVTRGRRMSFEDWLRAASSGAFRESEYATNLGRYLEFFPRERIHLIVFERATRDPNRAFKGLARFLGVDPWTADVEEARRPVNATVRPRFPRVARVLRRVAKEMRRRDFDRVVNLAKGAGMARILGNRGRLPGPSPETRARLFERYLPEIERLEANFGLDLPEWRPLRATGEGRAIADVA